MHLNVQSQHHQKKSIGLINYEDSLLDYQTEIYCSKVLMRVI